MSGTSATRSAALLLTGLLMTGCSGSDDHNSTTRSTASLETGFRSRANAACADSLAVVKAHPFPVKDFDPHKPDPTKLPAVAAHFTSYGQLDVLAQRLTALGEPPESAQEWDRLRSAIQDSAANAKNQIRTAAARDVPAFTATVDRAEALHTQIVELGTDLGFGSSSSCGQFFD